MVLYVDGGCSGNDTKDMAVRRMVAVVTDASGGVLSERQEPGGSNNIAELAAVHDALVWCAEHAVTRVELKTDSRNNHSWVFGKKLGKKLNDREHVERLRRAIDGFRLSIALTLTWVPREQNLAGHYIERTYGL